MILLKPHMLMARRAFMPRAIMRNSPYIIVGALMWAGLFAGTFKALEFVRSIEPFGDIIAMKLFSLMFLSLFWFLLLSNLITSIASFYLSKDIVLLLTRPVGVDMLIQYKSIQSAVASSWMPLFFLPAVLVPYGVLYNAPFYFYPLSVIVLLAFFLIPSGLGMTISHILTRLFPARRTRDMLMVIAFVAFAALYFIFQGSFGGKRNVLEGILSVRSGSIYMPGYWAEHTLLPLLNRSARLDPLMPMLLATNAAFFMMLSGRIAHRFYRGNLFAMHDTSDRPGAVNHMSFGSRGTAFILKDARMFFRDTEQWSQLLVTGTLLVVYAYNFKAIPFETLSHISGHFMEIIYLINLLLTGMVITAVAARFLYVSTSAEGDAFWIAKSSPITMRGFLAGKLVYGLVPVAVIMMALCAGANILAGTGGFLFSLSMATTLVLCISICGLATGMGALYPKFNYESLASVAMGLGAVMFMTAAFSVVSLTVALEGLALYFINMGQPFAISSLPLAAALALNAAVFAWPMLAGARKLSGDWP